MVEVMLAVRASSPDKISVGRVTKEPPPARAFCVPAHSPAKNRMIHMRRGMPQGEAG